MPLSLRAPPDESVAAAFKRARSALNLLADLQIAPTPARFTVAYAHQLGETLDLSLAMNRLIGHDCLSGAAMDELYQQFFAVDIDRAEIAYAGQKVMETLGDVALQLAAARQQQEGFAGHLRQFAGRLAEPPAALPEPVALLLDEIMQLITSQARLEDRLAFSLRELDALRRQLDRAEREARLDALTGIPNRAHFDRELRAAVARSRRDAEPLCLLMIDIDHFKAFNDRHGHQMGDQVLRLVARQLGTHAAGGGAPARYGGEEFALILRQCDLARAGAIAAQLRKGVSGKKILNRRTGESLGQVTLSIGAALYRPGESAADLVHRADEALYLAKARGRDQVVADDHPGLSG